MESLFPRLSRLHHVSLTLLNVLIRYLHTRVIVVLFLGQYIGQYWVLIHI